jgi:hypothetical protein
MWGRGDRRGGVRLVAEEQGRLGVVRNAHGFSFRDRRVGRNGQGPLFPTGVVRFRRHVKCRSDGGMTLTSGVHSPTNREEPVTEANLVPISNNVSPIGLAHVKVHSSLFTA